MVKERFADASSVVTINDLVENINSKNGVPGYYGNPNQRLPPNGSKQQQQQRAEISWADKNRTKYNKCVYWLQ